MLLPMSLIKARVVVAGLTILFVPAVSGILSNGTQNRSRGDSATGGDFLCFKSAGRRSGISVYGPAKTGIPFATRSTLRVKVVGPAGLDVRLLSALASQIAESMVLWKRACPECISGNISLLEINDTLYVDSYLLGYLRNSDLNNIAIGPPPTDLGSPTGKLEPPAPRASSFPYDVVLAILSTHLNARVPLIQYEPIAKTDRAFANLCATNLAKLPTLLHDVRTGVKCPGDPARDSPSPAKLDIYFLDGFTSCGKNTNIVGCSADDLVVELNARDYTFISHSTHDMLYGHGTRNVDFLHVILHEFGHWIGLPHLNSPDNLMSDSIDQSKCINDDVVRELTVEVLDMQSRQKGKGAFFYTQPVVTPIQQNR